MSLALCHNLLYLWRQHKLSKCTSRRYSGKPFRSRIHERLGEVMSRKETREWIAECFPTPAQTWGPCSPSFHTSIFSHRKTSTSLWTHWTPRIYNKRPYLNLTNHQVTSRPREALLHVNFSLMICVVSISAEILLAWIFCIGIFLYCQISCQV